MPTDNQSNSTDPSDADCRMACGFLYGGGLGHGPPYNQREIEVARLIRAALAAEWRAGFDAGTRARETLQRMSDRPQGTQSRESQEC